MKIQIAENPQVWDEFIKKNSKLPSFSQSWEWGDILASEGKKLQRLAVVEENGDILAVAQVVYTRLPFGWVYAFCPQGPAINLKSKIKNQKLYEAFGEYFKNIGCVFFRVEPEKIIKDLKLKKTIDINPPSTLLLNLNKSTQDLLAGMHSKTRYNIRLAEKKNIVIDNEKNVDVFYHLMKQTGSRDKFKLHDKKHYLAILASEFTGQATAYFEDKPIAVVVYIKFGNTCTYLYGASDYSHRHLMAPYLLQWHCIQLAKYAGCEQYDFFGVAPKINTDENYLYNAKHQYAGVTRFKLGFGGESYQSAGTWDFVISKNKYLFYKILRALRRIF